MRKHAGNSIVDVRGFTLIEVCLVIMLLAILFALMFPAINRALDGAKKAGCINNLRTWGIAMASYAAENNGELAMNSAPKPQGGTGVEGWEYKLGPYANCNARDAWDETKFVKTPLACPAEKVLKEREPPHYCYGMNRDLNYASYGEKARVRLASLTNASKYVILSDTYGINTLYTSNKDKIIDDSKVTRRHGGIPNFLYADGHVAPFGDKILGSSDASGAKEQEFYYKLWFANGTPPNKR